MQDKAASPQRGPLPNLGLLSLPAKALVTMVIFTMAIAMAGALGQIVVHDIIPTFFSEEETAAYSSGEMVSPKLSESDKSTGERGDLFATGSLEENVAKPFYEEEQFVWTLKWTHIHLFGMSMIFIFMGAITLTLDLSSQKRTWLIVLPFFGVLVDIAGVWLKGYISPAFFWLHIPGGALFGAIFTYVSIRALWEMWYRSSSS